MKNSAGKPKTPFKANLLSEWSNSEILRFRISIYLVMITLFLGTIGFVLNEPEARCLASLSLIVTNSFFKSITLLTLNGIGEAKLNVLLLCAQGSAALFAINTAGALIYNRLSNEKLIKGSYQHIIVIGIGRQGRRILDELKRTAGANK